MFCPLKLESVVAPQSKLPVLITTVAVEVWATMPPLSGVTASVSASAASSVVTVSAEVVVTVLFFLQETELMQKPAPKARVKNKILLLIGRCILIGFYW